MDTHLTIASKRDLRAYLPDPIPDDAVDAILDAGRVAGSGVNRQRWRFDVLTAAPERSALAACVYSPQNLLTAPLVVHIACWGGLMGAFDAGRAAQNMMLLAWSRGIASCPNGIGDPDAARRVLVLPEGQDPFIAISFGRPARPVDPAARTAEDWIARARRRPEDEVIHRH